MRAAMAGLVIAALAAQARAGEDEAGRWTYRILLPATNGTNDECEIMKSTGALHVGMSQPSGGVASPVIWGNAARPSTNLLPSGYFRGKASGAFGSSQVGYAVQKIGQTEYQRAALWNGTPQSFTNLHPTSSSYNHSAAMTVQESIIAGWAGYTSTGLPRPCLWTGPSHTFTDLFVASRMQFGYAHATDGTLVGGSVIYKNISYYHATIWNGTAASALDLNPAGYTTSEIVGMIPGIQMGYVKRAGFGEEAALWRGTTESLHIIAPEGVISSKLYDSDGTRFVGFVRSTGWASAAIWWGEDAATIEDIGALVKGAESTWAVDISSEPNGDIVVAGNAIFSTPVQITRGVVWRWSPLRHAKPEE